MNYQSTLRNIPEERRPHKFGSSVVMISQTDVTLIIQRMWIVKTKAIPVIIGATGTMSKSFRKYVSNIPGKHVVKELQKTAILGTAHIFRKVLM